MDWRLGKSVASEEKGGRDRKNVWREAVQAHGNGCKKETRQNLTGGTHMGHTERGSQLEFQVQIFEMSLKTCTKWHMGHSGMNER